LGNDQDYFLPGQISVDAVSQAMILGVVKEKGCFIDEGAAYPKREPGRAKLEINVPWSV
jgi:hypothetical protein